MYYIHSTLIQAFYDDIFYLEHNHMILTQNRCFSQTVNVAETNVFVFAGPPR